MCHSLAPRGPSPVKRTRGGCIRGQDAGRWWMLSTRCVERASERFSSLMPRNQLISDKALKRVCVCVCGPQQENEHENQNEECLDSAGFQPILPGLQTPTLWVPPWFRFTHSSGLFRKPGCVFQSAARLLAVLFGL